LIFNIDQNNHDYDFFFQNQAALVHVCVLMCVCPHACVCVCPHVCVCVSACVYKTRGPMQARVCAQLAGWALLMMCVSSAWLPLSAPIRVCFLRKHPARRRPSPAASCRAPVPSRGPFGSRRRSVHTVRCVYTRCAVCTLVSITGRFD
jgi:hypothetical protein